MMVGGAPLLMVGWYSAVVGMVVYCRCSMAATT